MVPYSCWQIDNWLDGLDGSDARLHNVNAPLANDSMSDRQPTRVSPRRRPQGPKSGQEGVSNSRASSVLDLSESSRLPPVSDATTPSTTSSRQRSPKRSASPVKQRGYLISAEPPILFTGATDESPVEIKELTRQFASIYNGEAILPRSLKDDLDSVMIGLPNYCFDNSCPPADARDEATFRTLCVLRAAAHSCDTREKPEPSWGYEVYWPLLSLALEIENVGQGVTLQIEDVTTTRVFPDSLLPKGTDGLPLESKRVDFALYISRSDKQKAEILELFTSMGSGWEDQSINQTSAFYTHLLPHICAVETKRGPASEGMVHLGIWMAALRRRLELLNDHLRSSTDKRPAALKPMPCLRVYEHDWDLVWCSIGKEGQTLFHGRKLLGSTRDIKGTYQVLQGLREIIRYGREDYWPWFKTAILHQEQARHN